MVQYLINSNLQINDPVPPMKTFEPPLSPEVIVYNMMLSYIRMQYDDDICIQIYCSVWREREGGGGGGGGKLPDLIYAV